MAENYSVVDFSGLSATSDGNTLLYANNQVCKSDKTLGQLIDGKIDGKSYATETFVTDAIDSLSGTVSTEYATKEELGKVGNFIVTDGNEEGPTLEPSEAETKNIYLVKDAGATGTDQYREWIVTENEGTKAWICIGDTSMDLSDYALSADVDAGLASKEDKVFVAEYGVTTYAAIKDAYDEGKQIFLLAKNFNDDNPEGWSPYTFKVPLTDFYSLGGDAWFKFSFFNDGSPSKRIQIIIKNNDVWSGWSNTLQDTLIFAGENNTITAINTSAVGGGTSIEAGTDLKIENGLVSVNTNSTSNNSARMNFAVGSANYADGSAVAVFGYKNKSLGGYTFVEGSYCYASGWNEHAEGNYTSAIGGTSHAEGSHALASGAFGHAEGESTVAAGRASHAEGSYTNACEQYSHAEGLSTTANGINGSHSEGRSTTANGEASHAEGYCTVANANFTHAAGTETYADFENETVIGLYNVKTPSYTSNPLFVIGNGTSYTARSDAFIVMKNGHASAVKLATSGIPDVESKITNLETSIGNIETILQSI